MEKLLDLSTILSIQHLWKINPARFFICNEKFGEEFGAGAFLG
jgi:hypothetical protein